jgi:hypothetical protein
MKRTIFILPILIMLFGITLNSCYVDGRRIKGQGPVVQQTFDLPAISGVSLSVDANVIITKGDTQTVVIEGQQNIINNVKKYISSDGIWRIGYYDPVKQHDGLWIRITTPHFDYAAVSGSGRIETNGLYSDSSNVNLNISGSGTIVMDVIAHIIESEISGSGQIYLTGSAFEHAINISGSGNIRAFPLMTQQTYVKISGSGNSEVTVENYLDVIISGSGHVYYKGNPQIQANISGSGSVIKVNN